ncbi:2-dehydropantoate 2-reductase [Nitrobacteraceae bacterium AZCC 1564]
MDRARVAVIGMGGIGGVVAALLQRAGRHDVVVCARHRISELTLEESGTTTPLAIATFVDPGEVISPVDWILLCTKAHDTASAALWFARLCRPDSRVAVLQNGVDQTSRVTPFVGDAMIVPTIVHFNGERIAPDRVRFRHAENDDLTVAQTAAGRALIELFEGTSLKVGACSQFATLQWRKLLLNAAANPLTTLTRQRLAVLRRDDIRALCMDLLDEGVAVARAAGADLAEDEAATIFDTLLSYPPEVGTSMYFDSLAGRPNEVDFLTGAIVRTGAERGIPTPANRTILALLRALNDVARAKT